MPSYALHALECFANREAAQPSFDFEPETPTDADFVKMIGKRRRELHEAARRFAAGEITIDQFHDLYDAVLLEGHTVGYKMGRFLAGNFDDLPLIDLFHGIEAKDAENEFLQLFIDALIAKDPRYWDGEAEAWRLDQIQARQDNYLGKMRTSSIESFIEYTPVDQDGFYWRLGAVEDHCEDCPELAAMSEEVPFTRDTVVTLPGRCETPCFFNCRCFLERVDGVKTFLPLEL